MNKYVGIEGNIGSGKTSLARLLAKKHNAKLILEEFKRNPFLAKFYEDPNRYAFQLELSFLLDRFQQIQSETQNKELFQSLLISDYTIEKCLIFSKNNLDKPSMRLYRRLYDIMLMATPRPDLIIYLHKEVGLLQQNIAKRARPYELNINPEYLAAITKNYLAYFKRQDQYPVLIVDANEIDFVSRPRQVEFFNDLIQQKFKIGLHTMNL